MNWTPIYKKYKNRWVALMSDEKTVIAFGMTAKTALTKAKAKGYDKPILMRVPGKLVTYVGLL